MELNFTWDEVVAKDRIDRVDVLPDAFGDVRTRRILNRYTCEQYIKERSSHEAVLYLRLGSERAERR